MIVGFVTLPLLVVSELSSQQQRERLRAGEIRETAAIAERTAAGFSEHLLAIRNTLVSMSGPPLSTTVRVDRGRAIDFVTAEWLAIGDELVRLYLLDNSNSIYVALPSGSARSAADLDPAADLFDTPFPRPDLLAPVRIGTCPCVRISETYGTPDHGLRTMISATSRGGAGVAEVDLARVAARISGELPPAEIYLADKQGVRLLTISQGDTRSGESRPLLTAGAVVPATDWQMVVVRPSVVSSEVDPALDQIRAGRVALVVVLLVGSAIVAVTGSQMIRQRRLLAERNAELARMSQEKSRFLANMSHELRTPLNAIIGFAQLLEEGVSGPLPAKQSEYVRDISESGKHQLALINDILDLSKVEAGKMEFRPEPFDVGDAVRRVHMLIAPLAQAKRVELQVDMNGAHLVQHDPGRFRQVLYNLLSNAVKFTPEGGSVSTGVRSDSDGGIELIVSDTGVGMSPEDLATIFQEFKRVGSTYAQAQLGTGLGLALVKRLVEQMGGTIAVTSAVGKGSTFAVRLPTAMPAVSDLP